MAFGFLISATAAYTSASSGATSAVKDTTTASLLVALLGSYAGSGPPTVSDSKTNTWIGLTSGVVGADVRGQILYVENPVAGTGHTFSASGANMYASLLVLAFTGAALASVFDTQSQAGGISTSRNPGSITPAEDNELLVSGAVTGTTNTLNVDSGFTLQDQIQYVSNQHYNAGIAWKIQTTKAAVNPLWSWGSSFNSLALIASFKSAAVAAGHPTMRRWGGTPFLGGQGINNSGTNSGKMWGRSKSGRVIVPSWMARAA